MENPFAPGFYETEELRTFGFKWVGEGVQVSKDCKLIGINRMSLGAGSRIDSATTIICSGGELVLEGRNHIGGQCHFAVAADLTIGEFSGTSQGVKIYTATDDYSGEWLAGPCVPAGFRKAHVRPITIGAFCIVGSGTVILPGCHMREGSAVGALSLVNKPLRAWTLYHGNPVRKVRDRSHRAAMLAAELDGVQVAA